MSDTLIWSLVELLIAPQVLTIGLNLAPKSFWRGLAARHCTTAHLLWGFSHLFGPLSRPGEPPAWERLQR